MAVVAAEPADVTGTVRGDLVDLARRFATISLVGGAVRRAGRRRASDGSPCDCWPSSTRLPPAWSATTGSRSGRSRSCGSLQLAGAGVQFGLVGALGYALLRGLMVGPPWFRLASISLGPGDRGRRRADRHRRGSTSRLLEPLWLAVGLFIALPTVYVALVSVGSERLLARPTTPDAAGRRGTGALGAPAPARAVRAPGRRRRGGRTPAAAARPGRGARLARPPVDPARRARGGARAGRRQPGLGPGRPVLTPLVA